MKIFIRVMAIIVISLAIILSTAFIVLKRGINISDLSLSNTQISNTHLTWDDKLKLEIERITVQPAKEKPSNKSSSGAKPSYVRDALRAANLIKKWFVSINNRGQTTILKRSEIVVCPRFLVSPVSTGF